MFYVEDERMPKCCKECPCLRTHCHTSQCGECECEPYCGAGCTLPDRLTEKPAKCPLKPLNEATSDLQDEVDDLKSEVNELQGQVYSLEEDLENEQQSQRDYELAKEILYEILKEYIPPEERRYLNRKYGLELPTF